MKQKEIDIVVSDDVVRVEVRGLELPIDTSHALFSALAEAGICIDLLCLASTGHRLDNLIFSVVSQDFSKVLKAVARFKKNTALRISVQGGYSKITLKGMNLSEERGIASGCFSALSQAGAEPTLVTASGTTLSVLVQTEALDRTLSCFEDIFGSANQEI